MITKLIIKGDAESCNEKLIDDTKRRELKVDTA